MELWQVLILAVVQGVTEFLPISSSGHLVIVAALTGVKDNVVDVNIVLHVLQQSTQTRLSIEGPVTVRWRAADAGGPPRAVSVDCGKLRILKRSGRPAFEKWFLAASVSKPRDH